VSERDHSLARRACIRRAIVIQLNYTKGKRIKLRHVKQGAILAARRLLNLTGATPIIRDVKQEVILATYRLLNQTGETKKKVFAVGFNKSGTTSLHTLFQSRGLLSYHGLKWKGCDDLRLLRSYDCFSDGIPKDLAKLDRLFPGSKFILQVRDLNSWLYSRLAHIERDKEEYAHHGGPEWDNTEYAIKAWIKKRNAHHLFVLSYFSERPLDILIVNLIRDESSTTKVCTFLDMKANTKDLRRISIRVKSAL